MKAKRNFNQTRLAKVFGRRAVKLNEVNSVIWVSVCHPSPCLSVACLTIHPCISMKQSG